MTGGRSQKRIDAWTGRETIRRRGSRLNDFGRTHYDADATAAEEPVDSSEAAPVLPTKRGRQRGAFLVEACHDRALLNVRESRWASVVVGSAAAHAGPLGPLPTAVTAREAIADLPDIVVAGEHAGSIPSNDAFFFFRIFGCSTGPPSAIEYFVISQPGDRLILRFLPHRAVGRM